MSWSFYATGKPDAVLKKAKADLSAIKCVEPEETIKGQVLTAIETALSAFPKVAAVTIEAFGSQSSQDDGKVTNSLSLKIAPIYGFVE